MKRAQRNLMISGLTLLPFMLLALVMPLMLGLSGGTAWLVRGIFLLLGLGAALLVFLYLRARARATPEPVTEDDEIDGAIALAKKKLKAARRGSLGKLPVVLVVGPPGSTKTTVVEHSGLQPELLSGEVYRDDRVLPTRNVNLWFADGTIFVEAGGRLISEPARFARLLQHVNPSRLAALLPGGRQAPRMALVCFGVDEFQKPGANDAVAASAQLLRARLIDTAASFGIRLPVYLLFTKTDRLPYFADFVRNFTRDEANEVIGTTLAMQDDEPGAYTEREVARISGSFDSMFRHLALWRRELLPRETAEETRAGVYEFPREVRKLAPYATQFLVDLCRPSQLGASPFLRGFYFTGVRAVMAGEEWAAPQKPAAAASLAADATSVFSPAMLVEQRRSAPAPGNRKVPEWTFLRRVWGQIVLRDGTARAATAGGTRVNLLRRVAIGSAGALCGLLSLAFVISGRANHGIIEDAMGAARSVETVDVAGASDASIEDLTRLDTLRAQLVRLRAWDADGPPRRYRWGLYAGTSVLDTLRPLYFQRFERMLWGQTRGTLVASLGTLPLVPNEASEYGATYDALKAYLITTSHPRESTVEFLAPELMKQWRARREIEPDRSELADRQFAFFAAELPHGNPYPHTADDSLVARTRVFLGRFGNTDQFYQALVSEASKRAEPVRLIGSDPVSDGVIVPGAYTAAGWTFVQENLARVDQLFARESWVLGGAAVPEGDRARLAGQLRTRYTDDYIRHWQEYLAGGRVVPFRGAQDASARLRVLSSPQSPLLRLLALAAQNTATDSATLGRAFQPVHTIVPPTATDRLIVEGANQTYMQGLVGLQAALDQLALAQGPAREGAISNARAAADMLKVHVQQTAQQFNSEGAAQPVAAAVEALLLAPIRNVEGLLTALPSADAAAKGQSFCSQFNPILRKFPFDPRSATEAQAEEVAAMFQPATSALWSFYQENLTDMLVRQGEGYGRAVGAARQPTREFEAFFNRAAEISRALFTQDGAGPQVVFELRPEPSAQITQIRIDIDGQVQTVTTTDRASRTFSWQAANGRSARMIATVNGREVTVASAQGPWAVFRLFHQSERTWERIASGHYRVRWTVPEQNLTVDATVRFADRIPIFKPDYFDRLQCVSTIVAR